MDLEHLKKRNWQASATHLVTALILLWAYNHWPASQSRSRLTAYRYQIAAPDTDPQCQTGLGPATPDKCTIEINFQKPKDVLSINVILGSVAFFIITSAAHAYYASDAFGSGEYTKNIMQGWNPYRWFEYGASASLMSVLVGLVDGTKDAITLWALFLITLAMQFNGFTVESLLRGHGRVTEYARDAVMGSSVAGWALFVALWSVIVYNFGTLVSDVKKLWVDQDPPPSPPVEGVPLWIWFILIMQFAYFASFGVVQGLHIKARLSGGSYNYVSTENNYIFLSYFAKLSLASGLAYGFIFRTKDCD